jgi:hypothetical protein
VADPHQPACCKHPKLDNRSDEAMKRYDEAFNASSLQFLCQHKRFIASLLYFFSIINVSSLHCFPNLPLLP